MIIEKAAHKGYCNGRMKSEELSGAVSMCDYRNDRKNWTWKCFAGMNVTGREEDKQLAAVIYSYQLPTSSLCIPRHAAIYLL